MFVQSMILDLGFEYVLRFWRKIWQEFGGIFGRESDAKIDTKIGATFVFKSAQTLVHKLPNKLADKLFQVLIRKSVIWEK